MRIRRIVPLVLLAFSCAARAEFPATRPFQPVTYQHERRRNLDMSIYVVIVDLGDPSVKVRVAPGGADPDGDGPWQTTLMTVKEIAEREKLDIGINASFFAVTHPPNEPIPEEQAEKSGAPVPTTRPLFQQRGYREGLWSSTMGWSMTDGKLWSPGAAEGWPIVWVEGSRRVHIGMSRKMLPDGATQIVAGNCYIVRDGKSVGPFTGVMAARHPRTVVGVDREGTKLVLLTVDGRRPGVSLGMPGDELAAEMLRLGCWDAINLDGGGSTTLVMRDPLSNELKVVNQPSDGVERPVADVLGITIMAPRQTTRPVPAADPSNN
jgi:exopolysaccharide biosynthesis protein